MIRNTKQREAVMTVIRKADRPLTPAEIYELAKQHYPNIGIRTVYRHVRSLADAQQIIGVDYPGQPTRYEVLDGRGSRPHLICKTCQNIFDLPIDEPEIKPPKLKDFIVDGYEVVFYGTCKTCKNK